MREEVIDIISRGAGRRVSQDDFRSSGQSRAAAGGEKDALSGAAALSSELQLGAVSADVAERLHQRAAAIHVSSSDDVGADIRMSPESLRPRRGLERACGRHRGP